MDYLLKPPANIHVPRHGIAIAILTLYSLFLLFMAWAYFRLLYIIFFDTGYTPRGPQWYTQQQRKKGASSAMGEHEKEEASKSSDNVTGFAYSQVSGQAGPPTTESAPGLQDFFSRNIFVAKGDGRPRWCSQCLNWKQDRVRHCREVDRCVRKMDHFCPWVGGVVSETSFKFFIQFTLWTTVFCFFNLVMIAKYSAESRRNTGDVNIHWIVSVALAGLFFIFSLGMSASSIQLVLLNVTTIENLSRRTIVWDLAVYMPEAPEQPATFPTISFGTEQAANPLVGGNSVPLPGAIKTYAILHSKPGENPWDLGAFRNFKSVMGEHWYDWFLPIKKSPCCDHSSEECQYEVGSTVERMRREAGINAPGQEEESDTEKEDRRRSRRKRRRRRRTPRGDTPTGEGRTSNGDELETANVPDAADIV